MRLQRNSSSATGLSGCASRAGRCAIPRRCCRNGPRARDCRRRSIARSSAPGRITRSEEHTSELQSRSDLVCRLLLEKKKKKKKMTQIVIKYKKRNERE